MRLTARDGIATLFVAGAAVVFILWTTGTAMAGLSTRAITVVVFALGWFACIADQRAMAAVYGAKGKRASAPLGYVVLASLLGGLALVATAIALVTGSQAMLATLMAAVAGLWLIATARHATVRQAPASHR